MHFQVRTDNHIENSEALIASVQAEVEALVHPRFTDRIRRVEVYLQDMNSEKKTGIDTRCAIEATLAGHQPVVVDERATSVEQALDGALEKLARALEKTLGRIEDRNGRVSMSGDVTP